MQMYNFFLFFSLKLGWGGHTAKPLVRCRFAVCVVGIWREEKLKKSIRKMY